MDKNSDPLQNNSLTNKTNNDKKFVDETLPIKKYIQRYFSQELENDNSLSGAMEKKQIKKWLLNWTEKK